MSIDVELIGAILGSSLLSAGLVQGVTWWRQVRDTKRAVSYLAFQIMLVFSRYAEDAIEVIAAAQLAPIEDSGRIGARTEILELGELPPEVRPWQELDTDLMTETLGFSHLIAIERARIEDLWTSGIPEDAIDAASNHSVLLALKALTIVDRLRRRYDLSQLQTSPYLLTFLGEHVSELPDHLREEGEGFLRRLR